jgi:hypothetical protein
VATLSGTSSKVFKRSTDSQPFGVWQMKGKDALRGFLGGQERHIWTEGVKLMLDSVEDAKDAKGEKPANIAVDTRLLKELLRGYKHAVERGYNGD